jgi:hypothetical protein
MSSLTDGALASEEADEIEDERDVRDISDIIDSGEDAVEIELAREGRRVNMELRGDVLMEPGHLSKL